MLTGMISSVNGLVKESGTNNITVGSSAGAGMGAFANEDNIFIGVNAGGGTWVTSLSKRNIAIGTSSMAAAMNGTERNTCIGRLSGTLITGDSNTCIGSCAGEQITTGGNNTILGAGSDGAAGVSNQIAIGYNAKTSSTDSIAIGVSITNSTARTVKFGDAGNSMISLDWDIGGDSTWVRSSDIRKKRNIKDSSLGLEFINKLRPVTYQWKPQNELPKEWENYSETNRYDLDKVHMGFIAQEVKAVIDEYDAPPEVAGWMQDSDGMQRMGESRLITPLIKAVQELSSQVEELKSKIG